MRDERRTSMSKKQSLALLLSAMMVATPFSAFAAEDSDAAVQSGTAESSAVEQQKDQEVSSTGASKETSAASETQTQSTEDGENTASDETSAENGETADAESDVWTASDFTYGEWEIGSNEGWCPSADTANYLKVKVHVVTGLSESGIAKLEKNTDLVIPAVDDEGNKVQGVGKAAFKGKGLTSVTFPENVKTEIKAEDFNSGTAWTPCDSSITERGDFFIGYEAFRNNKLTEVTLPEGVFCVATYAFAQNTSLKTVNFPSTIRVIAKLAFGVCGIESLNFTETTDFPLVIDNQAFYSNKIKSVWLPDETEKVTGYAFAKNTGVESSIVQLYIRKTDGKYIDDNSYQKPYIGDDIPDSAWAEKNWCTDHFTFDGTTITGLSEEGKTKIQSDTNLILPDKTPDGEYVTAIGNGTMGVGTFGYKDSENNVYVPTSVKLPAKLQSIGTMAFSAKVDASTGEQTGITSVEFPDTLTTIGATAFQNAPLTEVTIPDSVTTIGNGAFTTSDKCQVKITKAKLSKNLTAIPQALFNAQSLTEIDIPEGVTKIGRSAFAGNPLEKLSIPNTVTSIERSAFMNHQLKEIDIPSSVKTIDSYAFQRTAEALSASVSKITLHEGLTSIGSSAFAQALTSECTEIDLPTTVTTLDKAAFKGNATVTLYSTVADQVSGTGDYSKVIASGTAHQVVYLPSVTFNPGEGTTPEATLRVGHDMKLASLPEATLDGYTLDGWYTETQGGEQIKAGSDGTTFDQDTTVYAHWTRDIVKTTPTVTLSTGTYTYNGKVKTPGVTVKAEGKTMTKDCYDVSYSSGRKNVGIYKVTVTLKGNYEGSKVVTFKINPKKTSIKKVKKAKKAFKVTWNKQKTQVTGYQIQYSLKKNFKSAKIKTVTSNKRTSLKVKKLKKNKKYYVRVRTYKKGSGTTYHSDWSKAKTVKTK